MRIANLHHANGIYNEFHDWLFIYYGDDYFDKDGVVIDNVNNCVNNIIDVSPLTIDGFYVRDNFIDRIPVRHTYKPRIVKCKNYITIVVEKMLEKYKIFNNKH